ncbi:MAG: A/G-specific adenine glycosylase [Candidatus Riflebacteria bacterium]|nr:A/G-specific adenine glycosylase [Candidatus Riflebacteria bacterium]
MADPYAILVSEIMLQQTQVDRVIPFYRRWLERFPGWTALAEAPPAEVIRQWSGLGYNRRALMLQGVARAVVRDGVPATEEGWRALKGIGPYTAAAVTLFSTGRRTVPVDTNIRRAGGRLLLGEPFPLPAGDDRLRPALQRLLAGAARPADLVQALFDLASLVCRKTPLCPGCPLRAACPAEPRFRSGGVAVPRRSVPRSNERRHAGKTHPDRIYRGRILRLAGEEEGIALRDLGPRIDPGFVPVRDNAWLKAMVDRLVDDGLLTNHRGRLSLPRTS